MTRSAAQIGPLDVQAHANLLVLDPEWYVVAVSEGAEAVLSSADQWDAPVPLDQFFSRNMVHTLRGRGQVLLRDGKALHQPGCTTGRVEQSADLTAAQVQGHMLFSFEPPAPRSTPIPDIEQVLRLMARADGRDDPVSMMTAAAEALRLLLAVDTVSVHPAGVGGLGPALAFSGRGLHSDDAILRALAENGPETMLVLGSAASGARSVRSLAPLPLGVTAALLPTRAVSAGLVDALQVQGVHAVFAVPVFVQQVFWGVILGQHNGQMLLPVAMRPVLSLFATLLGHQIAVRGGGQVFT